MNEGVTLAILLTVTSLALATCPPRNDLTQVGVGHWYKMTSQDFEFDDAVTRCSYFSMVLAPVNTKELMDNIDALNLNEHVWVDAVHDGSSQCKSASACNGHISVSTTGANIDVSTYTKYVSHISPFFLNFLLLKLISNYAAPLMWERAPKRASK